MEVQKVVLDKTDTYLTYSLKRIGLDPHLCEYENFNEFFHQVTWKSKKKDLKIGDILLWDKEVTWKWMPTSISKDLVVKNTIEKEKLNKDKILLQTRKEVNIKIKSYQILAC